MIRYLPKFTGYFRVGIKILNLILRLQYFYKYYGDIRGGFMLLLLKLLSRDLFKSLLCLLVINKILNLFSIN